jgi:predicted ATP-binding protein involved in virulence
MYLKHIGIKNIGPINELSVELPFDENNKPKPILFVGENGTGKTVLLSQIVDSLYEIGSELFQDIGKHQTQGRSYYKVSGGTNLKIDTTVGFSIIQFEDKSNNKIECFDKIGSVTHNDFKLLNNSFALTPNNKNDNQKVSTKLNETSNEKLELEWNACVQFYQPAYRYEEPFWKNEVFFDSQRFEEQKKYSKKYGRELEIISSTKENKSYIMDLVLDFSLNSKDTVSVSTWTNINSIIRKIKQKKNIRFGIGPRGQANRISIVELDSQGKPTKEILKSIDNLSLGESILLNLFVNIIRHGDTPPKLSQQIKGIVIIDEIDVHLHTDLQNKVLPVLIKLFPLVQFIITTHSPLFILGMKKEFGENGFELRNMPNGEQISTERFTEFEKAYQVLNDTKKFEDEINLKIQKIQKPIVFVEGDYDIRYIKKACELFDKMELFNSLEFFDAEGYKNLDNIWNHKSNLFNVIPQKMLLLYDCDTKVQNQEKDKVFRRIIPFIEINYFDRGIENLFSKETINKAKEYKLAFVDYTANTKQIKRGEEIIIPEKFEVNKDEKGNLCTWICENGTIDDFKNFNSVFEILEDFFGKSI